MYQTNKQTKTSFIMFVSVLGPETEDDIMFAYKLWCKSSVGMKLIGGNCELDYNNYLVNMQIGFRDKNRNWHLLRVNLNPLSPLSEIVTKIEKSLHSHKSILNLCFGRDISEHICKFLPRPDINKNIKNFYVYKTMMGEKKSYYKYNFENDERLFRVIQSNRYDSTKLKLLLTSF